jgi:hypothetical protein
MTAIYGHTTQELATAVANTPLDEHRQCANCSTIGCKRVVSTDAPNTAFSFAAALTCGSDVCREKVRNNMQMMANAAALLDAQEAETEDAGAALDSASIAAAASAAAGDAVVPAEGIVDWAGQTWRSTKGVVLRRKYWSTDVTRHTSRLGSTLMGLLRTMKDRPLVLEMLRMVDADLGMRALITKQTLSKTVTLFLPSDATLNQVVTMAGGSLSDDLVEKLLTSLMASTAGGLPLNSISSKNPEIRVADMNRNTSSVITIRLAGNGGLTVLIPALAELAFLPTTTVWRISEVVDASNGRIMIME